MILQRVVLRSVGVWASLCALTLAPSHSAVHSTNLAVIEISFNERADSIEVVHRFSLHDADHIAEFFSAVQTGPDDQKEYHGYLATYVAERFSLHSLSDKEVLLTNIGSEISDGFLWVYQEAVAPRKLNGFIVQCGALMKPWSTPNIVSSNILVNVIQKGKVYSLIFRDSDRPKTIRFD